MSFRDRDPYDPDDVYDNIWLGILILWAMAAAWTAGYLMAQ